MRIRTRRGAITGLALGSSLLLLLGSYSFFVSLIPNPAKSLPDFLKTVRKPNNWEGYGNLNQALAGFHEGWAISGGMKAEVQNEVEGVVADTLKDQILQIRSIFDEEVRFRRDVLNNNLLGYQTRLNREMNRKLEEEAAKLNSLTANQIGAKEKELKSSFEKYRYDLRREYQKRLVDLNLQVVVGANPLNDFGNSEGISGAEAEIKRIHEELKQKLTVRQQQITDELTGYSKELHEANQTELDQLRTRLSETLQNELTNYQTAQESSYLEWYQKRSREISTAIELREKDFLLYSQGLLPGNP